MASEPVWVTVFADGAGGGNPCPVVFEADVLSTGQMQSLAFEFGAETVFVGRPDRAADVRLRYFVPLREMSMCVHATIAASVLLVESGRVRANPLSVQTELGVLPVEVDAAGSSAVVGQFPPVFGPAVQDVAPVLAALGLPPAALDRSGPICSVSTSRPKLLIPVRDEAVLDALTPDLELLWQACDSLDVTGFYPFAGDRKSIAARQFPVRAGYPEDPATGVAASALGAYLTAGMRTGDRSASVAPAGEAPAAGWHRWRIGQGRAMGRPSVITAESLVDAAGRIVASRVGGSVSR